MKIPQMVLLGEGLELTSLERADDSLRLHVTSTSKNCLCPLCGQPATRLHSRYRRVVKDLPCAGESVQLMLHVRKFFCDTTDCPRKVFIERLDPLVAPWAQMTTRLCQALGTIGLATCGRLGARLASRLGIATSWMAVVRRIMELPTPPVEQVECVGIDDLRVFAWPNGSRTVLVDLDTHRVIDVLPDRETETALTWMQAHREITHVSRDRGSEYASAATRGAPQAVQVADRFHVAKNLSEAVADLLARVFTELKDSPEPEGQELVEEWRPAPGEQVKQTISTHRAEREARYRHVEGLHRASINFSADCASIGHERSDGAPLAQTRCGS